MVRPRAGRPYRPARLERVRASLYLHLSETVTEATPVSPLQLVLAQARER